MDIIDITKLNIGDIYKNTLQTIIDIINDLKFFNDIHTKEILDNLGLIRYCCRRSVMSSVDLMDVI